MDAVAPSRPRLSIRRVNLDTGRENVAVISRRSEALQPKVVRGFGRVELRANSKVLPATLQLTDDDSLVGPDDRGLAEPAFRRSGEPAASYVTVRPAPNPDSLDAVRAVARKLRRGDRAVVDDIVSSGGTLIARAKVLATAGARTMDAIIIHALFDEWSVHTFTSSGVRSVRSTASIPHLTNAITLDSVLIGALRHELQGGAR